MKNHALYKRILLLHPLKEDENRLRTTFRILGYSFIIIIVFSAFKVLLQSQGLYQSFRHPANESLRNSDSSLEILSILFISAVLHPIVEELSFRYWISKNKRKILVGIGLCISIFLVIIFDLEELLPFSFEVSFFLVFAIIGLLIGLLLFKLFLSRKLEPSIYLLIVISSVLFSLLHLNVVRSQDNLFGYLAILLPYFIIGYLHGFVTYRIGFFYSFLMHALNNLILLSMGLFFNFLFN